MRITLGLTLLLVFLDADALLGQCRMNEIQKLTASDGSSGAWFGGHSDLCGDVALIGAPFEDLGAQTRVGSAYVFRHDGTQWVEEQKLTAFDRADGDIYGVGVAVEGNLALVGASADDDDGTDSGSVYAYQFDGTTWNFLQKITASDATDQARFGSSIDIEGNQAVIGATGYVGPGAAYMFLFDGSAWQEGQKIVATDGVNGDGFGDVVDLDGSRIAIGAFFDDGGRGSAYVFEYDGSQWVQDEKFVAPGRSLLDLYGFSVSLDGDTMVVGEPQNNDSGSAYVYHHDGTSWSFSQQLFGLDQGSFEDFGQSVAVQGNNLIVGADMDDDVGFQAGSAYFYRHNGNRWVEVRNVVGSDTAATDSFGECVALDGTRVMIGAIGDDDNGSSSGSLYVFEIDLGLGLGSNLATAHPGDFLILTTCGGLDGSLALLYVVDVSGNPTLVQLARGPFNFRGAHQVFGTVPVGLSGLTVDFLGLGFIAAGEIALSNVERVTFQ